jgi:NACHT domain
MQDLLEYWHDTLARDLTAYRDQGTDVAVDINGSTFIVKWQTQEAPLQATFRVDATGDFRWIDDNSNRSYLDFLASPKVSNLKQFSSATRRKFNQIDQQKYFVSPPCRAENLDEDRSPATKIIIDQIQEAISSKAGRTKVIFLKGDAGSGKTTLLQHLTFHRANTFSDLSKDFQFLFVSAQGRALSNIRDALAAETQSLKSIFTGEAVTPLTRHGLIVPIIDGFDELLGAVGYGDAFASLREFLDELDGEGVVVVSARSSFYDIEFASRVDNYDTKSLVSVSPISLLPWDDELLTSFLEKKRHGDMDLIHNDVSILKTLTANDRNLLSKPFFASQFADYVDSISDTSARKPILDYLIDAYILRESTKIVDRDGRALLDPIGHRRFFEEIADNMWTGASRFVTAMDLRIIAELVCSDLHLSSDASDQFKYKVTSCAGVSVFQTDRFAFEHDVYFDYFLSIVLARNLDRQKSAFLNRALLPREVSEQIAVRIHDKKLL